MGDRLSRDRAADRRRVHPRGAAPGPWDPCDATALRHPGGAAPGPWDPRDATALHAVLAAALRADDPGPEAERRAVAAFRTARDTGAHEARTRHRDDWRLPARGCAGRRRAKTTIAAVFTGIALGGVAVAAMGSVGSPANGTGGTTRSSPPAPARSGGHVSPAPSDGPGRDRGRSSAQDAEAQCHAHERVDGRGAALDAAAWQRLVEAAGGEDEVDAYCAGRPVRSTPAPARPGDPGRPGDAAANPGTGDGSRGVTGKGNPKGRRPGGGGGE
ncbi:hypothetical protein ACIQU3_03145 [Streptomyces sp. NPDC101110]|uniref:hypothetical protein n=1 Tax=Streptomyces sp. NPDC101110 TaxID=3366104 RepID=UPI0038211463